MGQKYLSIILAITFQFFAGHAMAAEPAFCDAKVFMSLEQTPKVSGIRNLHMFHVGSVMLTGMAVGDSDVPAQVKLAADHGRNLSSRERSCTWYANDGNKEAATAFIQHYVGRPSSDIEKSVTEYMTAYESSFDKDAINFVSCAEEHGYLAMGCDGMKHRGPTIFAMALSFAGCTPEHSVAIANGIWGTNGIPTETRIAIAQKAFELGAQHSDSRARFVSALTAH